MYILLTRDRNSVFFTAVSVEEMSVLGDLWWNTPGIWEEWWQQDSKWRNKYCLMGNRHIIYIWPFPNLSNTILLIYFSNCMSDKAGTIYDEYGCLKENLELRLAKDLKCILPFLVFNRINIHQKLCNNHSDNAG